MTRHETRHLYDGLQLRRAMTSDAAPAGLFHHLDGGKGYEIVSDNYLAGLAVRRMAASIIGWDGNGCDPRLAQAFQI